MINRHSKMLYVVILTTKTFSEKLCALDGPPEWTEHYCIIIVVNLKAAANHFVEGCYSVRSSMMV